MRRLPNLPNAPRMIGVIPVRCIDARDIHPGLDQPFDHAGRVSRGTQGAYDLCSLPAGLSHIRHIYHIYLSRFCRVPVLIYPNRWITPLSDDFHEWIVLLISLTSIVLAARYALPGIISAPVQYPLDSFSFPELSLRILQEESISVFMLEAMLWHNLLFRTIAKRSL
jgi:hypothetical protein